MKAGDGRRGRLSAPLLAEALLWAMMAAVALLVVPTARDAFTLPKLLAGEWLVLASLLVLAFGAARRGGVDLGAALRRPAVRAVLPLVAAVLLGWAFSDHRAHVGEALVPLAVGCAAVAGWSGALPARRLRRLLAGLLLPAVLLALLAALQFHGVLDPFSFVAVRRATRYGLSSLAGNPGHLAAFLAFACVVGQAVLPTLRAGRRRWLALAALLPVVYALVLTQTLVALAAVAVGSAVVWACLLPRRRALALAAALLVLAALVVALASPLRGRMSEKAEQLARGEVNVVLTGRLDGWRTALWMLGREPLTGVGHGAYVSEHGSARLALQERGVEFFSGHREPVFANAHNEYLEAAAEWGLVGVAALGWALWLLLAAVRRTAARSGADAALAWGGLAVLAVLALGHFPFRLALTGFPALLLLAWIFRRAEEAPDGDGREEPPRRPRWVAWGLVALLAAALALQSVHARDLLRANRILNAVEQTTVHMASAGRVPNTLLWANLRLIREAETLAPADARLPLAAGGQYLLLRRPGEAVEQYRRSLRLENRPETWLNLGRAQWAAGERGAAVESWVTAVRLHPRFRSEIPDEARREVLRAVDAEDRR